MEKSLTKIGNSMGFVVPKTYLKFLGDVVEFEMTLKGLLIKPKKEKVLSLKELATTVNMKQLFSQMEIDANDESTQEYYNSPEVQEFDNLDDIVDEH